MVIVIREESKFMPSITTTISEDKITVEENQNVKVLKYKKEQIKLIVEFLLNLFRDQKDKYIDEKNLIDEGTFKIVVLDESRKEYYIKNKYPFNWNKFVLFRNKLLREEFQR